MEFRPKIRILSIQSSILMLFVVFLSGLAWPAGVAAPPQAGRQAALALWNAAPAATKAKVEPGLLKELLGDRASPRSLLPGYPSVPGTTAFIVKLRARADVTAQAGKVTGKLARRQAVARALQETARQSQAGVVASLQRRLQDRSVRAWQSFSIFNGLAVEGGMAAALELAARPEVESLQAVKVMALAPSASVAAAPATAGSAAKSAAPLKISGAAAIAASAPAALSDANWNIALVGADRVWNELGVRGSGVVVASLGPGADWQHPALMRQYRGYSGTAPADHNHNWFDPDASLYPNGDLGPSQSLTPQDDSSSDQGTAVMGTMVGDGVAPGTQIGMAPGARWIAVTTSHNAQQNDLTDEIVLHKAIQWLLAPTDLSGARATADSSMAPDVVFCSWMIHNGGDRTFEPDLEALRAAGIVPVFAAGATNTPEEGTVSSPGALQEAFQVGATTRLDTLAAFSSRGPNLWGGVKPDVSAPGAAILSASGGDYLTMDGTTFAAAHVAGLAALLRSANPSLSVGDVEQFIKNSALDLGAPGADTQFGYGRIRAYEAVAWAASAGWIAGRVEDAVTHLPLAGVTVSAGGGLSLTAVTDAAGYYRLSAPAGSYGIQLSAYGYQNAALSGVIVFKGTETHTDASLAPLPRYPVSGQVLDAQGHGIGGAMVHGVDLPSSVSCDSGGNFSLSLPAGSWTLEAVHQQFRRVRQQVLVRGALNQVNFTLPAAPRILYVEADRWQGVLTGAPAREYYQRLLDDAGFLYDVLDITSTALPSAASLKFAYDVVIWQNSAGSPGEMSVYGYDAPALLQAYLNLGGRLFISGANIGQDAAPPAQPYFSQALHASLAGGTTLASSATGRGFLNPLAVDLNGPDSQMKGVFSLAELSWDVIAPTDPGAFPILDYDGGLGTAALAWHSSAAPDARVIYCACGFETLGPRAAAGQMLDRSLQWLTQALPASNFNFSGDTLTTGPQGSVQSLPYAVSNNGLFSDTGSLSITGQQWKWEIWNAVDSATITQAGPLAPATLARFKVHVKIPVLARPFDRETAVLRVASQRDATQVTTRALTALLVPPWENGGVLPRKLAGFGLAGVDAQSFYVIGGATESSITNETWRYANESWQKMAPKPTPLKFFQAAAIGHDIYCCGGLNQDSDPANVLEVYHADTDQWESRAPLPVALSEAACAVWGGKLFLFGGRNESGVSGATYMYDPSTDRWTEKSPLPAVSRWDCVAAELDGKIYLTGGFAGDRFDRYDPAGDTWEELPRMPLSLTGRQNPGIATTHGFLLVMGGGGPSSGLGSCFAYDPAARVWIRLGDLAVSSRTGCAAVAALGKIWVLGGSGGGGLTDSIEILKAASLLDGSIKTVDKGVASPGEYLAYTIKLAANAPASGITVLDPIPQGTTYTPGSATGGATYNAALNRVEWSGDLLTTLTAQVGFLVKVNAQPGTGRITNVCTIDDGIGQYSRAVLTMLNLPHLAINSFKRVDRAEAVTGALLTYTIGITNTGLAAANVTVTDPIPPGTVFVDSLSGNLSYNAVKNRIEATVPAAVSTVNSDYTVSDSNNGEVAFNWIDISDSGTNSGIIQDDQLVSGKPLGFNFKFFGNTYSSLSLSDNGLLLFNNANSGTPFYVNNAAIPTAATPGNFIAPFWDDLKTMQANGCRIWYQLLGSAPNRYFVVQYKTQGFFGSGSGYMQFEAILFENGDIKYQYLDMDDWNTGNGSSATIGLENASGSAGLQYMYGGLPSARAIHNNLAVLFTAPKDNRVDLKYRVRVTTSSCSTITNSALLDAGSGIQLTLTTRTLVNQRALAASKRVDKSSAKPGDILTYTVRVANQSSTVSLVANGITVTDPLAPNVTFVDGPPGMYNSLTRTLTGSYNLNVGGVVVYSYRVAVNAGVPNGTVIPGGAEVDYPCLAPLLVAAPTLVSRPDLSGSSKVVDKASAAAGDTLAYQIRIANSGATPTSATLADTLPASVTLVPGSLNATAGTVSYSAASRRIDWSGTASAGPSVVELNYRVTVNAGVQNTSINNQATIQWNDPDARQKVIGVTMAVPKNNTPPALTLLTPDRALETTSGTYTIRWQDADPDDNARISLYAVTTANGTGGTLLAAGIGEDDPANQFTISTANLKQGVYWIYGVIDDGISPPVISYAPGSIALGVKLSLANTVDKTAAAPGSVLTYTLQVANTSTTSSLVARGIVLTAPIPANTTFEAIDLGPAMYSGGTQNQLLSNLDLAPGDKIKIVYRVRINSGVGGSIVNTARLVDGALPPLTVTATTAVQNESPRIVLLNPVAYNTPTTQTFTVRWTDSDSDNNAKISLYVATNTLGMGSTLLAGGISEDDPANRYVFNTISVPDGIYRLYAVIDDGINPPVTTYAPGSILISRGMAAVDIINHLLGKVILPPSRLPYADVNGDGQVDVADVILMVQRTPADAAGGPKPVNAAVGVSVLTALDWADSLHATGYDVTLWKASDAKPSKATAAGLTASLFTPSAPLAWQTTYLWQVTALKAGLRTDGPVWSFTTEPKPVQLLSPNGGEVWTSGSLVNIHWKTVPAVAGTAVRIELWRAGKRIRVLAASSSSPGGDKIESVALPNDLPLASDYKVVVASPLLESTSAPTTQDESDGYVSLQAARGGS